MAVLTQMEKHLLKFVEDTMTQKFRMDETIRSYREVEVAQRERVIDQNDLIAEMTTEGHPQVQIDNMKTRRDKDQFAREVIKIMLADDMIIRDKMVEEVQAHLSEFSARQIKSGGFVAHTIIHDRATEFDAQQKIIKFKEKGHVEVPVSTYLNSWKDSSQMRILINEK